MKNEVSPLHATGPQGEQWSFNPANSRWTLEYEGKKSSSASTETLRKKLDAWIVARKASAGTAQEDQPVRAAEEREVMLMLLQSRGIGVQATPVAVRASWDPAQGLAEVEKVKKFSREGSAATTSSGWSKYYDGYLVDPFDPTDKVYEALKERMRASVLANAAHQAESTIAQAWLTRQGPASATIQWQRHEGKAVIVPRDPTEDEKKKSNYVSSHHRGAVPEGVGFYPVQEGGIEPSSWKSVQNAWVKGDVRIAVGVANVGPEFRVQARGLPGTEEGHHTVFSSGHLEMAMQVAEITHDVLSSQEPSKGFWRGSSDWATHKGSMSTGLSWPAAVDVLGILAMREPSDSVLRRDPVVMVLQKNTAVGRFETENPDAAGWKWASEHMSPHGSLDKFWSQDFPPPRELVDSIREELHAIMSSEAGKPGPQIKAPIRPSHPDDPRPLVETSPSDWQGFRERVDISKQSSAAICSAWARQDEAVEPEQAEGFSAKGAMENEWGRLIRSLKGHVQSDPEVVKAIQKWDQLAKGYDQLLKAGSKPGNPKP